MMGSIDPEDLLTKAELIGLRLAIAGIWVGIIGAALLVNYSR